MINYALRNMDKLLRMVLEHLQLTSFAIFFALIFASLFTMILLFYPKIRNASVYLLSILYAIPSFALFALLIPFTGLGQTTAIVVLVVYAQYALVRSFLSGLTEVDPAIIEAARGIGMTKLQMLTKIQLPLAMPSIIAGIKVASSSTIAIATIGATINAGGLGTILFDGLRTMSMVKLGWGTILTVSLSLLVILILDMIEELVTPKTSSQ